MVLRNKLAATVFVPALLAGLALSGAASAAPTGPAGVKAAPDSAFVQVASDPTKAKKPRRHHGPPSPVTSDRQ